MRKWMIVLLIGLVGCDKVVQSTKAGEDTYEEGNSGCTTYGYCMHTEPDSMSKDMQMTTHFSLGPCPGTETDYYQVHHLRNVHKSGKVTYDNEYYFIKNTVACHL